MFRTCGQVSCARIIHHIYKYLKFVTHSHQCCMNNIQGDVYNINLNLQTNCELFSKVGTTGSINTHSILLEFHLFVKENRGKVRMFSSKIV